MNSIELRIPPLALLGAFGAAQGLVAYLVPATGFAFGWSRPIAALLAALGAGFSIAGVLAFRAAKTTVDSTQPELTSEIVTSGVYGLTRNPMYVGFVVVLLASATWLSNILGFLCVPAFALFLNRFQIEPEERQLRKLFGASFLNYEARVRRWL
jgi:protein-S-isoprenylcysteine O-methyltransferase Ste14